MRLHSMSFPIWWVMNAVAIAACVMGIVVALSNGSNTVGGVVTGLACFYGIPILLIVGRKVPLRNVVDVASRGTLVGLPFVLGYGLLGSFMSGFVAFIGCSAMMMALVVWAALIAASFSTTRPLLSNPDRPTNIDHLLSDIPETVGERY